MVINNTIVQFVGGVSDFIISGVACWAIFQLIKQRVNQKYQRYYLIHFILLAISTLIGGIAGHLLADQIAPNWKLPGWILSMIAVTCLERAIIAQSSQILPKKWVKALLIFNLLEFLFFACLTINTLSFRFVAYHAAYGLLVIVLGIGLLQWAKGRFRIHLFLGLLFSLLAAIIFQMHLSISIWWNYLGLSHIMLAFSTYFFYKLSRE